MNAYDGNGAIQRFDSAEHFLEYFYPVRLDAYRRRKDCIMQQLMYEELLWRQKVRFLEDVLRGDIPLISSQSLEEKRMETVLQEREYPTAAQILDLSTKHMPQGLRTRIYSTHNVTKETDKKVYGYLLDMPLRSLTQEHMEKLREKSQQTTLQLQRITSMSPQEMWLEDLKPLEDRLRKDNIFTTAYNMN